MEQVDCLSYTLCLKQLSIACNLILEGVRMITQRWTSSHRCSWMTVYVCCCISQSNLIGSLCLVLHCYALLSPVNCPAVICYPACHVCLSKENTSSELWTPVQSLPLIHLPLLVFTCCKPPSPSTPYS